MSEKSSTTPSGGSSLRLLVLLAVLGGVLTVALWWQAVDPASWPTYGERMNRLARRRVEQGLDFLREVRLTRESELHRRFFPARETDGRDGRHVAFLRARVSRIDTRPDLRGTLAASGMRGDRLVWVAWHWTDEGWRTAVPTAAAALVHEAVHDRDGFPHVDCPTGSRPSGPLCDAACDGPFAHEAVLAGNIANWCSSCSEDERELSRHAALRALEYLADPACRAAIESDLGW